MNPAMGSVVAETDQLNAADVELTDTTATIVVPGAELSANAVPPLMNVASVSIEPSARLSRRICDFSILRDTHPPYGAR
jgi:hypothetical protein